MKRTVLISSIIFFLMITTTFIMLLKRNNQQLKITTFKKDYNYVYSTTEENTFEVSLYVNQLDSPYLNKNMISKVYLSDKYGQDYYRLFVKDLVKKDDALIIKKEKFYNYLLIVNIESLNDEINIKDASIIIEYLDNNEFNIQIGWVSLFKVESFGSKDNELSICHLKGFTFEDDGVTKLKAVLIGLRNNSSNDIQIKEVNVLASDVYFSEAILIYDPNVIFLEDYEFSQEDVHHQINIELNPNETKYYILPIKYLTKRNLSRFGLKLDYIKNDLDYTMYFDDFVFFTNNKISENMLDNLIINKYVSN